MSSLYIPERGNLSYTTSFDNANVGTTLTVLFWYKPLEDTSTEIRSLIKMRNLCHFYIPAGTTSVELAPLGNTIFTTRTLTGIINAGETLFLGFRFVGTARQPRMFVKRENGDEVYRNASGLTTIDTPTRFKLSDINPQGARGYVSCVRVFKTDIDDLMVTNFFNLYGSTSYSIGDVAVAWDFTELVDGEIAIDGQIKNVVGNLNGVDDSELTPDNIITGSSEIPLYYRRR